MMKERTLRVLEFTKIRDMLTEKALTPLGAEKCQALAPSTNFQEISEWQEETEEALVVLTYVGGHPMAGTENSGFKHSRADMFRGASMIVVPEKANDLALIERVRALLAPVGFGRLTVTTAEKHDEMIAFTSQLAHVVSNAYMKSPTAGLHKGFSAGSYKDMTRVAWLNETMWTELFLDNSDYLIRELDLLTRSLQEYRDALARGDAETLKALLADGRRRKEEVDRK